MQMMLAFSHCPQVLLIDMHMHTLLLPSKVSGIIDHARGKYKKRKEVLRALYLGCLLVERGNTPLFSVLVTLSKELDHLGRIL